MQREVNTSSKELRVERDVTIRWAGGQVIWTRDNHMHFIWNIKLLPKLIKDLLRHHGDELVGQENCLIAVYVAKNFSNLRPCAPSYGNTPNTKDDRVTVMLGLGLILLFPFLLNLTLISGLLGSVILGFILFFLPCPWICIDEPQRNCINMTGGGRLLILRYDTGPLGILFNRLTAPAHRSTIRTSAPGECSDGG